MPVRLFPASHKGREKVKTVIVKDRKGAYEILRDYIGHTLKDVRYSDGTHVEQLDGEIVLEFDEPVEPQTAQSDWAMIKIQKENNKALMRQQVLCWLFGPDVDGGE